MANSCPGPRDQPFEPTGMFQLSCSLTIGQKFSSAEARPVLIHNMKSGNISHKGSPE